LKRHTMNCDEAMKVKVKRRRSPGQFTSLTCPHCRVVCNSGKQLQEHQRAKHCKMLPWLRKPTCGKARKPRREGTPRSPEDHSIPGKESQSHKEYYQPPTKRNTISLLHPRRKKEYYQPPTKRVNGEVQPRPEEQLNNAALEDSGIYEPNHIIPDRPEEQLTINAISTHEETDRQKWDRLLGNMFDMPPWVENSSEASWPSNLTDSATNECDTKSSTDLESVGNTASESVGNAASVSTTSTRPTDSSTNGSNTRNNSSCISYCVTRGTTPAPIDYSKVKASGQTTMETAARPIRLPASVEKSIVRRRQKTTGSMAVNRRRHRARIDFRHGAKRSSWKHSRRS